jgi:fumarate reductase flavoprotein subunit
MADWLGRNRFARDADEEALRASIAAHEAPFTQKPGDLNALREELYACMWDEVGILRTAEGLRRGLSRLDALHAELARCGVADGDRVFNLTWHDWLNLDNLIAVSRAIATAALAREDSRGAHFREDFPQASSLAQSDFTVVRQRNAVLELTREPVRFSRVKPGESLIGN